MLTVSTRNTLHLDDLRQDLDPFLPPDYGTRGARRAPATAGKQTDPLEEKRRELGRGRYPSLGPRFREPHGRWKRQ